MGSFRTDVEIENPARRGEPAGDQVVFGEPGDLNLLGSRSLEGLNLVVDPVNKRLVDAGAMPAAAA